MKNYLIRLCTIAAFAFLFIQTKAQTLFTYGNNKTSASEFLRAYNKNNVANDNKEKAVREYLKLYSNFKLKVKAAQDLKLDTLEQLKYDVKNFRDQIIDNYLVDNASMQALIKEAMERSTIDIHVLYYLIPFGTDTNLAKKNAFELQNKLNNSSNKEEAFNTMAASNATIKHYDIGYITTFSVNYDFENIIYNTKLENASVPFKNTKGWHIFLPLNTRPAVGKWNVAQILFAFPPNALPETKSNIKHLADSVYSLLNSEKITFSDAAKKYSDDRLTNQNGGVLQEFGTGKYKAAYEEKIFTLNKDSSITIPFETDYGYHIVQRINHKNALTDIKDLNAVAEIKQKIILDSRKEKEATIFKKKIKLITGFYENASIKKELFVIADTLKKNSNSSYFDKKPIAQKVIATFNDGTKIKGLQWITFVKEFYSNAEYPKTTTADLLNQFYEKLILEKYKNNLEKYNEEFKLQMQEFKDGNLLFEIMDRNVWSKASADKNTLQNYYEKHKQKYTWDSSANIVFFNCNNYETSEKAIAMLQKNYNWKTVADSIKNIQTDSGRFELNQFANYSYRKLDNGLTFSNVVKNADGSATFLQYLNFYKPNEIRSFDDAKGLVTNDYQILLEQQWLDTLSKKYPVKYNEAEIKKIIASK